MQSDDGKGRWESSMKGRWENLIGDSSLSVGNWQVQGKLNRCSTILGASPTIQKLCP